jgi:nucleotide-binding universal stress UspA family protein
MNTRHKLLAPVDFSAPSRIALEHAARLAAKSGAELLLLHVLEEADLPVHSAMRSSGFPNLRDEIRKGMQNHMAELRDELVGDKVPSQLLSREGLPSAEIVDTANELGVDTIVIATHGRAGLKRFLLGSTTERVVRMAGCSVLVVRPGRGADRGDYHKILVPTDFSERSKTALPEAVRLAEAAGGRIMLLHVIAPLPWPVDEALKSDKYPLLRSELRKSAKERLRELRETAIPKSIKSETHIVEGDVEEEIIQFATGHDIDAIVMASEGHRGLKRLMLGSSTERVVRNAPCTVLVARKPDAGVAGTQ